MPSDLHPAILIVEDQEAIRELVRSVLTQAGYITLEASHIAPAETMIRSHPGKIRLAIVNVVLPDGSGLDFANQLDVVSPGTKLLYISDLAHSVAVQSIRRSKPDAILLKPFTEAQLLARVQEILGQRS